MTRRESHRFNQRGGVMLDLVVGLALVLLGACVLSSFGVTFHEIVHGASRFFGLG